MPDGGNAAQALPRPETKKRKSNVPTELPSEIKVGVRVEVLVPPKCQGVVRFAGTTDFSTGVWVGVELSAPEGKNDGSVKDVRYFKCPPNCGIFVRPAHLKLLPESVHKESDAAEKDSERGRQPHAEMEGAAPTTVLRGQGSAVLAEWLQALKEEASRVKEQDERRLGDDGKNHSKAEFEAKADLGDWHAAKPVDQQRRPAWKLEEYLAKSAGAVLARSLKLPGVGNDPDSEMAFIKALGSLGTLDEARTRSALGQWLYDQDVHSKFANSIMDRAKEVFHAVATSGEQLNDKFAADGHSRELSFGTRADFFNGLEGRIGSPLSDVMTGMIQEHCDAVDSHRSWTSGNYGITTTSEQEFLLVAGEVLDELRRGGDGLPDDDPEVIQWREDVKKLKAWEPRRPLTWPPETKNMEHPRAEKRSQGWLQKLRELNTKLRKTGEKPLLLAEAIALCLYTGPLFEKYNGACRGGCEDSNAFMKNRFEQLCGDGQEPPDQVNRYPTTINVLASALVKASKLSKAETVSRGISGGILPKQFWEPDESGVKGGVEYGFLSTTSNREVAMHYAQNDGEGTILEMHTGMIDKGADLTWVSQYPHEKELCFPPLTSMQVTGTSVEGKVLVVSVRLNLNLTSPTIDEVIAKRWKIARDMCSNLKLEARKALPATERFPDFRQELLNRIGKRLDAIAGKDPNIFNDDSDFQENLKSALELKQAAQFAWLLVEGKEASTSIAEQPGEVLRILDDLFPGGEGLIPEAKRGMKDLRSKAAQAAAEAELAPLRRQLNSDVVSRRQACEGLHNHAKDNADEHIIRVALKFLYPCAQDSDIEVRLAACKALAGFIEIGGRESCRDAAVNMLEEILQHLLLLCNDSDAEIRYQACDALKACAKAGGKEAADKVIEHLQGRLSCDTDPEVIRRACEALGAWAETGGHAFRLRALELLFPFTNHLDVDVQSRSSDCISACIRVGDEEATNKALNLLEPFARYGDVEVRLRACRLLKKVAEAGGQKMAVEAFFRILRSLCEHGNPEVRMQAMYALEAIVKAGGENAIAEGLRLLQPLSKHCFQVKQALRDWSVAGRMDAAAKAVELSELLRAYAQGGDMFAGEMSLNLLRLALAKDAPWQVCTRACRNIGAWAQEERGRYMHQETLQSQGFGEGEQLAGRGLERLESLVGTVLERFKATLAKDISEMVREEACKAIASCAQAGGDRFADEALALLEQALSEDLSVAVRKAACHAIGTLAQAGSSRLAEKAFEVLQAAVAKDGDGPVRIEACWAIGAWAQAGGDLLADHAFEAFKVALNKDGDRSVRIQACQAIGALAQAGGGRFTEQEALTEVAQVLQAALAKDGDWSVRYQACQAIGALAQAGRERLAEKAFESLQAALAEDGCKEVRIRACQAIGDWAQAGGEQLAPQALKALQAAFAREDGYGEVRYQACQAIGALAQAGGEQLAPEALKALQAALAKTDGYWSVRIQACQAIGAWAQAGGEQLAPQALEALQKALAQDGYWQVRIEACQATGALAHAGGERLAPQALRALQAALAKDGSGEVRYQACLAVSAWAKAGCEQLAPQALEALQAALAQDGDRQVRKQACHAIGAWAQAGGEQTTKSLLAELVRHKQRTQKKQALGALQAALAEDSDQAVRKHAIEAIGDLAKAGGEWLAPEALKALQAALANNDDWDVRYQACLAIGVLAQAGGERLAPQALGILQAALGKDSDKQVRIEACWAIGAWAQAGGEQLASQALWALGKALAKEDEDWEVRKEACEAIGAWAKAGGERRAPQALWGLQAALTKDENGQVRRQACQAIGAWAQASGERLRGLQAALAENKKGEARKEAFWGALLERLKSDSSGEVRKEACQAIGALAQAGGERLAPEALKALEAALAKDPYGEVRYQACQAIGAWAQAGGEQLATQALEALGTALARLGEYGEVRIQACQAIGAWAKAGGEQALKALQAALAKDDDRQVRQQACQAIGMLARAGGEQLAPEALKALQAALAEDGDKQVRIQACQAIGAWANPGGKRLAKQALKALQAALDRSALPPQALKGDNWEVSKQACQVIGNLARDGGESLAPGALEAFQVALAKAGNIEVHRQACEAIGEIQGWAQADAERFAERAFDAFQTALKDADEGIRDEAYQAIGALVKSFNKQTAGHRFEMRCRLVKTQTSVVARWAEP